jgi:hypothetical protein
MKPYENFIGPTAESQGGSWKFWQKKPVENFRGGVAFNREKGGI